MAALITATDLVRKFSVGEVEVTALDGISFTIEEGELTVILGPSGSGKSTMLNLVGGIDTPTSGTLYYRDLPLHAMNKQQLTAYRRDHIGFIFQFYNLMPNLTALENILLAGEMSEHPLDGMRLLEQVGLSDRADHFPSRMSGGQQQRVAIARALCKNPDLLLCDEPTGALDITTGGQILKLLSDFHKEYHKTVVLITHNADIAQIADRVFTFRDGNIVKVTHNEHPLSPDEVHW